MRRRRARTFCASGALLLPVRGGSTRALDHRAARVRHLALPNPTVTLTQVRKVALALPEVEEAPHFDRTSFRVRNKIFVTAKPAEPYIHVFVGEEHREPALAMHPGCMEKLVWGGKVVGLRIALPTAPAASVNSLVRSAWESKAPRSLLTAFKR